MLLTIKEVCKQLKITRSTLRIWEKQGKIKRIKLGDKSIRYESLEIKKFAKGGVVESGGTKNDKQEDS